MTIQNLELEHGDDGRLWVERNGVRTAVRAQSCFPWSASDHYISLRDDQDAEVALIGHLEDLDEGSRKALMQSLRESRFVLTIERVESIEDEFEIRNWKVVTHQGPRTFQTKCDEWPQTLPGGGMLIPDVAGDLFHIADVHRLDTRSRHLLWSYIDE